MTSDDAAALIEAFREQEDDTPPLNPYVLANAYLKVLGSLAPDRDAFWQ